MNFFKIVTIAFLLSFAAYPIISLAQESDSENFASVQNVADSFQDQPRDEAILEARVIEILEEKEITREDRVKFTQQNLKLEGLHDEWENKEMIFEGIGDLMVINQNIYKKGDKVLVAVATDMDGN